MTETLLAQTNPRSWKDPFRKRFARHVSQKSVPQKLFANQIFFHENMCNNFRLTTLMAWFKYNLETSKQDRLRQQVLSS